MSEPQTTTPPRGWYADPSGAAQQRWWAGDRWTDQVREVPAEPAAQLPQIAPQIITQPAYSGATFSMIQPAIASLIFGIISLALNPLFLASIVAFGRGRQALRRARAWHDQGNEPHGRAIALWGIWLGVAGLLNGALLTWFIYAMFFDYPDWMR